MREGHGSKVAEDVAKRSGLALPQLFLLLLWAVMDSSVIGSSSPPVLLPSGMERTGSDPCTVTVASVLQFYRPL